MAARHSRVSGHARKYDHDSSAVRAVQINFDSPAELEIQRRPSPSASREGELLQSPSPFVWHERLPTNSIHAELYIRCAFASSFRDRCFTNPFFVRCCFTRIQKPATS